MLKVFSLYVVERTFNIAFSNNWIKSSCAYIIVIVFIVAFSSSNKAYPKQNPQLKHASRIINNIIAATLDP